MSFCVCLLGVHTKNLVAILHLLVALARHFRAPVRLPENVCVTLLVVQVGEHVCDMQSQSYCMCKK